MPGLSKIELRNEVPAIIRDEENIFLSFCVPGLLQDGTMPESPSSSYTADGNSECGILAFRNGKIEYRRLGSGYAFRLHYQNRGARIMSAQRLFCFSGRFQRHIERVLANEALCVADFAVNDMRSHVNTCRMSHLQTVQGTDAAALIDEDGNQIVLGFLTFERYFSIISICEDGSFCVQQQLENRPVEEGEVILSDWFYIGLYDDVRTGLIDYAKLTAKQMNTQKLPPVPAGFCTWYYYGAGISPDTIQNDLTALGKIRETLPLRYYNIDDGWYREWGDWTENEKFSCGMKHIGDQIREAGFLPGIWLAAFGSTATSPIAVAHPDWFVHRHDAPDQVQVVHARWGDYLTLDMSAPGTRDFIRALFRKLSYEWGYRHIKVDIISEVLAGGLHYDPSFTSAMNFREGIRLMRESVTEDTVILICSAPIGHAVGYAQGTRTSCDVCGDFHSLKDLFSENLKRYYFHGIWYNNDPDCLMIRDTRSEDAECARPCTRNEVEIKTFATAMAATGGALIFSDKFSLLPDEQLKIGKMLFPQNTTAAIPLDLMESDIPGVLDFGIRGNARLYALINWSDDPLEFTIPDVAGYVFEQWGQTFEGIVHGSLRTILQPHESKVFHITKETQTAVIGTDDCLIPTILQSYENGTLRGSFLKKDETLYLAAKTKLRLPDTDILCVKDGIFLYRIRQSGNIMNFCIYSEASNG